MSARWRSDEELRRSLEFLKGERDHLRKLGLSDSWRSKRHSEYLAEIADIEAELHQRAARKAAVDRDIQKYENALLALAFLRRDLHKLAADTVNLRKDMSALQRRIEIASATGAFVAMVFGTIH